MTNTLYNSGQTMTLLNGSNYTLLAGEVGINGVVYNQTDVESVIKDEDSKSTAKNVAYFSVGDVLSNALTNKVRIGIKKISGIEDMPAQFSKYNDWFIDNVRQTTVNACITNIRSAVLTNIVVTIFTIKVSLTASEIKNIGTTPIDAIPAPSSGQYIKVLDSSWSLTWNSVAFDDNTLLLTYDGGSTISQSGTSFLNVTADKLKDAQSSSSYNILTNTKLIIDGTDSVATGDSTVDISITYEIITL